MNSATLSSPNPAVEAAGQQWLFTEEELLLTPTILDGFSAEQEREARAKGVNFITQVGIMLKLPQLTISTASIFLHRFFMRHSMVEKQGGIHYYSVGATALFLATKVEENCRKIKELVIACCRIAQKNPTLTIDDQSKEYWKWRDTILHNEDVLLEALCFDMNIKAPYSYLYDMLHTMKEQDNKRIRHTAWAFVTDSLMTMACLVYTPRTIAGASIYFAGKFCQVEFNSVQEVKWWDWVGCKIEDLRSVNNMMATFYEGNPLRKGSDNEYRHTPEGGSPRSTGNEDRREMLTPNAATREGDSVRTADRSGRGESVKRTVDEMGSDDTHHSKTSIVNGHEENEGRDRKRVKSRNVADGNGTLVERPARNGQMVDKDDKAGVANGEDEEMREDGNNGKNGEEEAEEEGELIEG